MQHNAEISARISKSREATGNRLAFFRLLVDFYIPEGRWTKFLLFSSVNMSSL